MIKQKFAFIILLSFLAYCNSPRNEKPIRDIQTERALAEAEAAKQKTLAAEADRKRLEAELALEKEKQAIAEKNAQRIAQEKVEKTKSYESKKQKIGEKALSIVRNSASEILQQAYPLAMKRLKYTGARLVSTSGNDQGYNATVRLNYTNLFRKPHYLELLFDYDPNGAYRSWKYVNHTDIVAPKELTVGSLLKLTK